MTGEHKTIACAVDGGASLEAVKYAANLARELSAELVLVHVQKEQPEETMFAASPDARAREREQATRWIELASSVRGEEVRLQLASGSVADGLVEFARKSACDVLVLSTRARGPLRYAAGSAVGKVLVQAPCPVLVVPAAHEDLGSDFPGQVA